MNPDYVVCIVEDESTVCSSLKDMLYSIGENFGYFFSLHSFDNVLNCLKYMKNNRVDIIFLDYQLNGGLTGDELLDYIIPEISIYVILMSGRSENEIKGVVTRRKRQLLNHFYYIPKPLTSLNIQCTLQQVLSDMDSSSPLLVNASIIKSRKIFISYSHKDSSFLDRVLVHLSPVLPSDSIEAWSDKRIEPGALWSQEIESSLNEAKVAILLISADFLASEYINKVELPRLIKRRYDDGAIIIPLFLKPTNLRRFDHITQYQGVNTPKNTVIEMSESEQEKLLAMLSQRVEECLGLLNTGNIVESVT